ncbi:NDR1/HIN1-like protein 3 [Nymphaea colorata]|uniref:NDR1/HIN1-like protein 3 n=1 Tax=Nymphaea colorata TaxID=210225 RepID=UPI00129DA63D|nr:NDR1/HIN1-like protein 3 [Nymphaea colorata]
MPGPKEGHLPGGYAGTPQGTRPLPPYRRPHRGRACCGICLLLKVLIKIIVAIVIVLAIAALVVWLVLRPTNLVFYAENAYVTSFNLTNAGILTYDLKMDMSLRNPNKKVGVYYEDVEVLAFYGGQRFGWINLPSFYQGHKNTTMIYPAFGGKPTMISEGSVGNEFNRDSVKQLYHIVVKLKTNMKFKVGSLKTNKFSARIVCDLLVPLAATNSSGEVGFSRTKCDLHVL